MNGSVEQISLDDVNDLFSFYQRLEENALYLERYHDITELLIKYRNKTTSEDEKQKIQWEMEVFLFSFLGNRIFSFSSSNGIEPGEISEYPSLDSHQSIAFEFIKERAKISTSSLLKARYNHVLWKSIIKKNRNYALNAIESYIHTLEQLMNWNQDNERYLLIGRLYENLVSIVNEINASINEAKELTHSMLFTIAQIPFWAKHGIIEDMLKYPKIFKAEDFKDVLKIFDDRLKEVNARTDDFALINYHLPTAIKVAQKLKANVKKWHEEIGEAYLRMAEKETESERSWIKLEEYRAAIDAFRLSGNYQKKKATEQLYFELKPQVHLEEYRVNFDEETIKKLHESNDEIKEKALTLLKEPPEYIYSIISGGHFFPKYADVLKASMPKENHFLDFVTTLYFDNNKNISKKSEGKEEQRKVLEVYGMRVKETLLPFLHYIIVLGIKSGHLTYRNFLKFLVNNTWIGKPHVRIDLSGNPEATNWVYQVAPAIIEFFNQVLAWGESKYYRPNFILCIDSLTLKIEGLFRNFSERLNISTSKGKKKGMEEALIHDIISNEAIKKFFNEDDILLFDYVFSNEGGLNLRNNIAHCFYSENEYHPDKMLLLLAVLLRLGKYNLKANKTHLNTINLQ